MSLVLLYKDTLIADQRAVTDNPHAIGTITRVNKLHLSKDKTFAFGSAGPTLSNKDKLVLEEILRLSFIKEGSETNSILLEQPKWFDKHFDVSFVVLTKECSYYAHIVGSKYHKNGNVPQLSDIAVGRHHLVQFDSDIPGGYGTGLHPASMAALEGVNMNAIVPLVAEMVYSVSAEFDLINRKQLRKMAL